MDSRTVAYYDSSGRAYFDSTVNAFVPASLDSFLSLVREGGRILDCGCGSGRDTKYFLSLGYPVDMIDASENMCRIATEYTGRKAVCMDYMNFRTDKLYSGIWANASLLNEKRENLGSVFSVLSSALEDDGILYCSFRYGSGDRREGERWYTDMNEERIGEVLPSSLRIVKCWQSNDVRPSFSYRWLNVLLRKQEHNEHDD